jgi:hypothetical protein
MAKQSKKRKKKMAPSIGKPSFETKLTAPKTFGAQSGLTSGSKNAAAMRSPGSQRKR